MRWSVGLSVVVAYKEKLRSSSKYYFMISQCPWLIFPCRNDGQVFMNLFDAIHKFSQLELCR